MRTSMRMPQPCRGRQHVLSSLIVSFSTRIHHRCTPLEMGEGDLAYPDPLDVTERPSPDTVTLLPEESNLKAAALEEDVKVFTVHAR